MGKCVSTVLVETNGVITEERYQKLKPAQWNFQYLAIQSYKSKHRTNELKNTVTIMDMLAQDIESLAMVISPKIGAEFIKNRQESHKKRLKNLFKENTEEDIQTNNNADEADINSLDISDADSVKKYMEKYYDTVPNTITIPKQVMNQNRYFLPKFNRKKLEENAGRRKIPIDIPSNSSTDAAPTKKTPPDNPVEVKIVPKKRPGQIKLPEKKGDINGNNG